MEKFELFLEYIRKPVRPLFSWIFPIAYLYGWFYDFSDGRMEHIKPIVMLIIGFWFGERMIKNHGSTILESIMKIISIKKG